MTIRAYTLSYFAFFFTTSYRNIIEKIIFFNIYKLIVLFINRNVNETFQINTTCPVVQFHLLLIKTSWSPSSICTSFASYYFHSNPFAVALRSSSLIFPIPNEVVISCNIAYCYIVSLGFQANRLKWSYDHLRIFSGSHFRYCRAGSDALCAMYI